MPEPRTNLLAEYNRLRSKGYTTVWTGEGRICMEKRPMTPEEAEQLRVWNSRPVFTEVRAVKGEDDNAGTTD